MALALQVRVRGMQQLLDMMHRQLWQCSRDCVDEVRVLHLDERTSQKEARGFLLSPYSVGRRAKRREWRARIGKKQE